MPSGDAGYACRKYPGTSGMALPKYPGTSKHPGISGIPRKLPPKHSGMSDTAPPKYPVGILGMSGMAPSKHPGIPGMPGYCTFRIPVPVTYPTLTTVAK